MIAEQDKSQADAHGAEHAPGADGARRGLWQRTWVRVITYVGIAGVLILAMLPIAMKHYLQNWLLDHGAEQAVVRDIDFNPFRGSLRIEHLAVKIGDRVVMGDADVHVNLGLTALLKRTITVQSATLDNVVLEIELLDGGRIRLGSLVLGVPDAVTSIVSEARRRGTAVTADAEQPDAGAPAVFEGPSEEARRPWHINLEKLTITDSEIRYLGRKLNTTLSVTAASIEGVDTTASEDSGKVTLEGSVNGARITFAAALKLNPGLTLDGTVAVEGLQLKPLAGPIGDRVDNLEGIASLDGRLMVTAAREQAMAARYDGSVSLADSTITQAGSSVSGDTVDWRGTAAVDINDTARTIGLDGTLSSIGLAARVPGQGLTVAQDRMDIEAEQLELASVEGELDVRGKAALSASDTRISETKRGVGLFSAGNLVVPNIDIQGVGEVNIPAVEIGGVQAGLQHSPGTHVELESLTLESVRVTNLTDTDVAHMRTPRLQIVDRDRSVTLARLIGLEVAAFESSGTQKLSARTIDLGEATLFPESAGPEAPPPGTLGATQVSGATYTPDGLAVDAIKINGLNARIVRRPHSPARAEDRLPESTAAPPVGEADRQSGAETETVPDIGAPEPDRDKAFKFNIGELALAGDGLVYVEDRTVHPPFRVPVRISELKLTSRDREKTFAPMNISLSGALGEYAAVEASGVVDPTARGFDGTLHIEDANMIALSPYTVRMMGYQVNSGHMTLDSDLRVADGRIDSRNRLFLRELHVDKASAEIAAEVEAEIGMPVEKNLDLLRDKHGNIELDVPISGELADLRVGLGGAISTALLSTLKSSALAYLKIVNLPYGAALTLLEKLKKGSTKIRVDPIEYAPGKSELPATAQQVVSDVAARLKKDKKLDVRVCPYVTPEDLVAVRGRPLDDELDKELVDRMFLLGHDRAAGVKERLIAQHNADPARVIICVTKYDKKKKATGRVRFIF